jgi:uncharacterized protein (DUF302 family)
MTAGAATVTYAIPEAFQPALRCLRQALNRQDLRIAGELDLSRRIQRSLQIKLAPCVVLYIWPSAHFLENNRISAAAALLLPLHVVVSACGDRTEIHLLRPSSDDQDHAMAPVRKLQAQVRDALEKIAMRLSLVS